MTIAQERIDELTAAIGVSGRMVLVECKNCGITFPEFLPNDRIEIPKCLSCGSDIQEVIE